MLAAWTLILVFKFYDTATSQQVPMPSKDACLAAAEYVVKEEPGSVSDWSSSTVFALCVASDGDAVWEFE